MKHKLKSILLISFTFLGINAFAQTKVSAKHFNLTDSLAVEGYDVVSYFSDKAIKGKSNYSAVSEEVKYYFSNEENKTTFLANPDKYKPMYGGWCAYGMADNGEKVSVDPKTFKIVDGKLYLFYNAFFNNTLTTWNKDEKSLKIKADKNWAKLN